MCPILVPRGAAKLSSLADRRHHLGGWAAAAPQTPCPPRILPWEVFTLCPPRGSSDPAVSSLLPHFPFLWKSSKEPFVPSPLHCPLPQANAYSLPPLVSCPLVSVHLLLLTCVGYLIFHQASLEFQALEREAGTSALVQDLLNPHSLTHPVLSFYH